MFKCSALRQVALAAALIAGMALSPAKADTETWDFLNPTGELGVTQQNYLSSPSGLTLTANGFAFGATTGIGGATPTIDFNTATNLFGKNDTGAENGLGISNAGRSGNTDNEITAGISFIRIQLPTGLLNPVLSQMGSTTDGEGWAIYGSTSATSGYSLVATGTTQLTDIDLRPASCSLCTYYAFFATGTSGEGASNVLLHQITGVVSNVPLPGALPLFATGIGLIGLLGMRRKRKTAG